MELANIFPSKYIKAADLKGKEPTVVIAKCEIEKLGDDNKLVIYFQHKEKGLVCNRTNADRIAYLYGTNTDAWVGKEITLYTDMVNFQGKVTEAIRVKPPAKHVPIGNGNTHTVTDRGSYKTPEIKQGEVPSDEIPF
jgi:hypothetical protein